MPEQLNSFYLQSAVCVPKINYVQRTCSESRDGPTDKTRWRERENTAGGGNRRVSAVSITVSIAGSRSSLEPWCCFMKLVLYKTTGSVRSSGISSGQNRTVSTHMCWLGHFLSTQQGVPGGNTLPQSRTVEASSLQPRQFDLFYKFFKIKAVLLFSQLKAFIMKQQHQEMFHQHDTTRWNS